MFSEGGRRSVGFDGGESRTDVTWGVVYLSVLVCNTGILSFFSLPMMGGLGCLFISCEVHGDRY